MRIRKDSKPYKVLKTLALAGGFLVLSSIAPAAGAQLVHSLIGEYFRKKRFEREKLLRDLKSLQRREFINYKELPDERIELTMTKLGKEKILTYDFDKIKLDTKRKWDGKWRLIIFDIPEYKRAARDALRQKLNQIGFYSIQKSVLLTPHECEDQIDFLSTFFNVRDHLLIFHVQNFEGEEKFRHHFKLD